MSVIAEVCDNSGESAPTDETSGVDVRDWSHVHLAVDPGTFTDVSLIIWLRVGQKWVRGTYINAGTLTALDFDNVSFPFSLIVACGGASRIFCQINAVTTGAGSGFVSKRYSRFNTWSV